MKTHLPILCLVLLAACSILNPTQRDNMRTVVQQEYEAGNITAHQRDATMEALDRDEPVDWEGLGLFGINAMLALVGAPMIVRRMRGPPENLRRAASPKTTST